MRKTVYILLILVLYSCTSNTILEPPKDLIPKDTMTILIQDMMLASSAKFIKNEDMQKNINYMHLINEKYNIDSVRFQSSNEYYISKIDDYIKIFQAAKLNLETKKKYYEKIKKIQDSVRKDSLKKMNSKVKMPDSKNAIKTYGQPKTFLKKKSSVNLGEIE